MAAGGGGEVSHHHPAPVIGYPLAGAARMVGVSIRTAKRMMKRGIFPPARKIDGMRLWTEEDVREWFRSLRKVS